ncbi:MAG TPA: FxSxx-COOH system tetratricopeptide repeat protein [Thermoanaerobaculia bacterium]|nr:FxSxx-COOH system tetratricopeptide repeat protein [Thermoanaerobaculia bacterium]
MPEAQFDVFLSHNSQDKDAVLEIARALKERGLRPWLDAWELIPGRRWQEALEEILETARTTAVLVGKDGFGPWQTPEMRASIDGSVERNLPVIPVLLPGAPEKPKLPLFLLQFTWVDLRRGVTREGIDRLVWGVKGEKVEEAAGHGRAAGHGPARHNLPYLSLGGLFKGREEELLHLAADLDRRGSAAIAQNQVLSGLGGIGKTRLAVEYAWRYGWRYQAALFVRADSREGLRRGLAALAAADLLNLPERQAPQEDETVGAVLRWLQEGQGWLLILDNVDTQEAAAAVSELLPRLAAGHVLVTSRWTRWGPALRAEELEKLPAEEAVRFLLERTAGPRGERADDAENAERLAALLGGLPLALEQAAAYIAQRRMSFADYLVAWSRERQKVLAWFDPLVMAYPEPVAVTWQRSFDALGPAASALLRLSAFLARDPIPVRMFEQGRAILGEASGLLCGETGQGAPGEPDVPEAMEALAGYSLISWQEGTFTVHGMVQEVVRGRIPAERRREWIELSLRLVDEHAPSGSGDVRTWPTWDLLRSHAAEILGFAKDAGCPEEATTLMSRLATLLHAKALYREAEPLKRRALQIDEARLGTDHPRVAVHLNNLAQLLEDTNRLAEAEVLMRRALRINEARYGTDHPEVATGLNNLAALLKATNRLVEAERLMRKALQIDEANFGTDHPAVARDLNNLAQLLQATNRLAEAEPLMRRALQIDEATFGIDQPEVARDLNNLAVLLRATNRLAEAEPLMRRALQIDEASFGIDHPIVGIRLNNLAALLQATNRLAEAEPLLRRALQIDEARLGTDHPRVATELNNLAQLLQATNRVTEAEPLMRRVIQIDEASYGTDHPEVAIDLNNLARLLQATNRPAEAEPLLRRALTILQASLGEDHPTTQTAKANLEALLEDLGPHP